LEFRIPGKVQPLDSQHVSLKSKIETVIEPVSISRKREEIGEVDETSEILELPVHPKAEDSCTKHVVSKEIRREELSKCLIESIDDAPPEIKSVNGTRTKPIVEEDVQEQLHITNPTQTEDILLTSLSAADDTTKAT